MHRKKRMPVTETGALTSINIPTTDPQGSYTGRPLDPFEQPVQDADDL